MALTPAKRAAIKAAIGDQDPEDFYERALGMPADLGAVGAGRKALASGLSLAADAAAGYDTGPLLSGTTSGYIRSVAGRAAAPHLARAADFVAPGLNPLQKYKQEAGRYSGDILRPSTWRAGPRPNVSAFVGQSVEALGSLLPIVAAGPASPEIAFRSVFGGTKRQEQERIEGTDTDELLRTAPGYKKLVDSGMDPRKARRKIAEEAGLAAGVAAATTSPLEFVAAATPLGRVTRLGKLGNIAEATRAQRFAKGVTVGGVAEAGQEVGEQVLGRAGAQAVTGETGSLTEDTFGSAVFGFVGGAGPGGVGGALSSGAQQETRADPDLRQAEAAAAVSATTGPAAGPSSAGGAMAVRANTQPAGQLEAALAGEFIPAERQQAPGRQSREGVTIDQYPDLGQALTAPPRALGYDPAVEQAQEVQAEEVDLADAARYLDAINTPEQARELQPPASRAADLDEAAYQAALSTPEEARAPADEARAAASQLGTGTPIRTRDQAVREAVRGTTEDIADIIAKNQPEQAPAAPQQAEVLETDVLRKDGKPYTSVAAAKTALKNKKDLNTADFEAVQVGERAVVLRRKEAAAITTPEAVQETLTIDGPAIEKEKKVTATQQEAVVTKLARTQPTKTVDVAPVKPEPVKVEGKPVSAPVQAALRGDKALADLSTDEQVELLEAKMAQMREKTQSAKARRTSAKNRVPPLQRDTRAAMAPEEAAADLTDNELKAEIRRYGLNPSEYTQYGDFDAFQAREDLIPLIHAERQTGENLGPVQDDNTEAFSRVVNSARSSEGGYSLDRLVSAVNNDPNLGSKSQITDTVSQIANEPHPDDVRAEKIVRYLEQQTGAQREDLFQRQGPQARTPPLLSIPAEQVQRAFSAMEAELRKIAGPYVRLRLENIIPTKGGQAAGAYRVIENLVRMSRQAAEPFTTLYHEAFHVAQYTIFTNEELAGLTRAFSPGTVLHRRVLEAYRRNRSAGQYQAASVDFNNPLEVQAYAFELYKAGKFSFTPKVKTLMDRLVDFLDKFAKWVGIKANHDIPTANADKSLAQMLFRQFAQGQLASRARPASQVRVAEVNQMMEGMLYTSKVINSLPKKANIKKDTIRQLTVPLSIKKTEKDLIKSIVDGFDGDTIPRDEFITRFQQAVMPWHPSSESEYAGHGLGNLGFENVFAGDGRGEEFVSAFEDSIARWVRSLPTNLREVLNIEDLAHVEFLGADTDRIEGPYVWQKGVDGSETAGVLIDFVKLHKDRYPLPEDLDIVGGTWVVRLGPYDVSNSESTIWQAPEAIVSGGDESALGYNHFHDPKYLAHSRSFISDGIKHIVELQSDLAQKLRDMSPEQMAAAETKAQDLESLRASAVTDFNVAASNPDMTWEQVVGKGAKAKRYIEVYREHAAGGDGASQLYRDDIDTDFITGRSPVLGKTRVRSALRAIQAQATLKANEIRTRLEGAKLVSKIDPKIRKWVVDTNSVFERMIREEMRKAAMEGHTVLRFPTLDTVAAVEGWSDHPADDLPSDLGSLERRYHKNIPKFLVKEYGAENVEPVEDGLGNTWLEVRVDPALANSAVMVFQRQEIDPDQLIRLDPAKDFEGAQPRYEADYFINPYVKRQDEGELFQRMDVSNDAQRNQYTVMQRVVDFLGLRDVVESNETLSYFGKPGDVIRHALQNVPIVRSVAQKISDNMGLNTVLHMMDANPNLAPLRAHKEHLMEAEAIKNDWRTIFDTVAKSMLKLNINEREELGKVLLDETISETFMDEAIRNNQLGNNAQIVYAEVRESLSNFLEAMRQAALERVGRQFEGRVGENALHRLVAERKATMEQEFASGRVKERHYARVLDPIRKRNAPPDKIAEALRAATANLDKMWADNGKKIMEQAIERNIKEVQERVKGAEETRTKMLSEINAEFDALKRKPYFPLARFGEYVVEYTDKDGQYNFELYETPMEQAAARREAEKEGIRGVRTSILAKELTQSGAMMLPMSVIKHADKMGLSDQSMNLLQQFSFKLSNPGSFLKHRIRRKGVKGFTDDVIRAYASYGAVGSSYLSRAKMYDILQADMSAIREFEGGGPDLIRQEMANNLEKKLQNTMLPGEEAAAIKQLGFMISLAAVPKAALVNLSGTYLIGTMDLSARYGVLKAHKHLARAFKDMGYDGTTGSITIKDNNPQFKAALEKAGKYGIINQSLIMEIGNLAATGPENWRYKSLAGVPLGRYMEFATFMFSKMEEINRNAVFTMTWRMEFEKHHDADRAYDVAVSTVQRTMFEYARWNRPDLIRGPVKGTVFQFKNFAIQYTKLLMKGIGPNATKQDRLASAYMLGMLFLMAGLTGLPFGEDALDALDWVMSEDNVRFDSRRKASETLAKMVGDKNADIIMYGLSRATPFDVHGSLGMGRLIPGVEAVFSKRLDGPDDVFSALGQNLGPTVTYGSNVLSAFASEDPDIWKRYEKAMPNFMKHPSQGIRWMTRGKETDRVGRALKSDFTGLELAGKAAGFASSELAQTREDLWYYTREDRFYMDRRSNILDRFDYALQNGNRADLDEVMRDIEKFNTDLNKTGNQAYSITGDTIRNSMMSRGRTRALMVPRKQFGRANQE